MPPRALRRPARPGLPGSRMLQALRPRRSTRLHLPLSVVSARSRRESGERAQSTMISFSGGRVKLPLLWHENFHRWWGDNASEAAYEEDLLFEGAPIMDARRPSRRTLAKGLAAPSTNVDCATSGRGAILSLDFANIDL